MPALVIALLLLALPVQWSNEHASTILLPFIALAQVAITGMVICHLPPQSRNINLTFDREVCSTANTDCWHPYSRKAPLARMPRGFVMSSHLSLRRSDRIPTKPVAWVERSETREDQQPRPGLHCVQPRLLFHSPNFPVASYTPSPPQSCGYIPRSTKR